MGPSDAARDELRYKEIPLSSISLELDMYDIYHKYKHK